VYLVGYIIRIYHDAWSCESQNAPEEAEKVQEPESEPKERTMTVLRRLRGLDTLKPALRCLSKLIQISTVQQQLDKNL
jgi:hypothetical protein